MKDYAILILILISASLYSFAENSIFDSLDYYRVYTNYNGSAYNGKVILCYGEGGVIVGSNDGGNNWFQTNLDDSFNVMCISNIGRDFFGVINEKYIIKSTDDGKTWQMFDYGINTEFYKIIAYNNSLYCISNTGIIVCNTNVEKLKEYLINTDTAYYDFTISGNNLVYSAGHGKLGIINLQNDNTRIVDLKDFGICTNCPVLKNFFSDGNLTYFNLNYDLYQYNEIIPQLVFSPIKNGKYASNNGEVFEIYNIINESTNLDSLFFVKIDINSKKATHIKSEGNDRYISALYLKNLAFLTKDTIISVGRDKLIYMSYNRGGNWNLKSHFNIGTDAGDIYQHDFNHANRVSRFAKFLKTSDGGITWLSQKNYNEFFSDFKFGDPWNYGKTYFADENRGFVYRNTLYQNDTNFAFTNDGGENVKLKNVNDMIGYTDERSFITLSNNNNTIFVYPGIFRDEKYTLLFILDDELNLVERIFIDSAQVLFMDKFDNEQLFSVIVNFKYPKKVNNDWVYDSVYYSLISSMDYGTTWQKELDFLLPKSDTWFQPITKVKNNIFLPFLYNSDDSSTYYCDIYKLNVKTKKLEKILTKEKLNISLASIVGFGNFTIINGYYLKNPPLIQYEILYNNDIENQPENWTNITPTSRYNYFIRTKNDSLINISGYDSLMKSKVMWFAKPKKVTNVEEHVEISNLLYLSKPYPNPTQDYVKTKVYWDMKYNFEDAIIEVYDIMGKVVSDKKQILFNQINNYSGELTWLTKNQQSGLYIISVKLGGEIKAIPVVIIN